MPVVWAAHAYGGRTPCARWRGTAGGNWGHRSPTSSPRVSPQNCLTNALHNTQRHATLWTTLTSLLQATKPASYTWCTGQGAQYEHIQGSRPTTDSGSTQGGDREVLHGCIENGAARRCSRVRHRGVRRGFGLKQWSFRRRKARPHETSRIRTTPVSGALANSLPEKPRIRSHDQQT